MKKTNLKLLAIAFLIILYPSLVSAEEHVLIYKTIQYDPIFITEVYYDGQKVATLRSYSNGKEEKIGKIPKPPADYLYKEYDMGKLFKETTYKDGKPCSTKSYSEKGVLSEEVEFGIRKKTYNEDGKLCSDIPEKNGVGKIYFENGNLSSEVTLVDGKRSGVYKFYYENGNLHGEMSYMDDELNGVCKDYYENGNLHGEMSYMGGRLNGVKKIYDVTGQLDSESTYLDNIECPPTNDIASDIFFGNMAKQYNSLKEKPALPKDARKFVIQAQDAADQKRYNDAINLYKQALDIAPWWSQGHYDRALLLGESDGYEEAIAEMKKYLLLEPHAKDTTAAQDDISKWEGRLGK